MKHEGAKSFQHFKKSIYDLSAERMVGHRHILLLLLDTPKIGIVSAEKKSLICFILLEDSRPKPD